MSIKRRYNFDRISIHPVPKPYLTALGFAALLSACAGDDGSVPGDAEDMQPFAQIGEQERVNFAGTEPFWDGSVVAGQLTWSTPENIDGTIVSVTRFAGRGGLSFSGTLEQRSLDLTVTPGDCTDGMSDRIYPLVATVSLGEEILNGCAWRDSDDLGPPP